MENQAPIYVVVQQPKSSGCARLAMLCVAAISICVGLVMLIPGGGNQTESDAGSTRLKAGDAATVNATGGAWFATSDASFDELIEAQNANSQTLIFRLADTGKAFREPVGSKVLVVKGSIGSVWCRITEGANEGKEGWTQREGLIK